MKQILQDLKNGETLLADVPSPGVRRGQLLIRSAASLVSIGTEKVMIDFGKAGWIGKARRHPDKVRRVIEKIKTDGLGQTLEAVNAKLGQVLPLGYSNVGRVIEVGADVRGFQSGDLVVSNGPHAEVVAVPKNLCARVPDGVAEEDAVFTVVGSIGLQGIRLLKPTVGEYFAVTGLGLIGLLAVQILRANGCRVLGIDFDARKCELAQELGAEVAHLGSGTDPVNVANQISGGKGLDGVLITAATKSNGLVHQAALMCRKRGRIVLVGVAGLNLSRADFYEKELSFQVSCSYGPGRYDPEYEEKGRDYPYGFVRWTEQRNFEAILGLMERRMVNVGPLISHQFEFSDALRAYERVGDATTIGIVLKYAEPAVADATGMDSARIVALKVAPASKRSGVCIGVIGAGGFTGQVLVPGLAATDARLKTIVSATGVTGTQLGKKYGFENSSTDADALLDDDDINTVVIATHHNTHARLVLAALRAGKHVYVEKPLCLNDAELTEIVHCYRALAESDKPQFLLVGFNRRFSPQVQKIKSLISSMPQPKAMILTVNSGAVPSDHWVQDLEIGGGRVVGECCHFIDLLRFLAGSEIKTVRADECAPTGASGPRDTITIQLGFRDGSIGAVHYFSNGNKGFPKERLEVFCGGKILSLDNFRRLSGFGWSGFSRMNLWKLDKGHAAEMRALVEAVKKGESAPIPFDEIVEVTRASFAAAGLESRREGKAH
ncbi:MAG: Inositol 2-dehydrogenase [Verrucomicrobia subdivision 3 bacterium]|nr:Inositol 2-dehydrogenase [Limisphaerales bacterium]MCS1416290.1 Inositol 2-dehydrogenase [Limisphaerales bacterium]